MATEEPGINPKVHSGAAGGVGGYAIGKALSRILTYYLLSAQTPPEVLLAFEVIIEAGAALVGVYLGGYLKGDLAFQRARGLR